MLIYLTENMANGKMYIGKDTNENSNYLGSGTAFRHALKKYGNHNFKKHVLIAGITTEQELNLWEAWYIDLFGAVKDPMFYNLVPGGQGFSAKEIYQFDKQGNFIKKFNSLEQAADEVGIKNKGNISLVAEGKRHYAGKYRWSYTNQLVITEQQKSGRKIGTKNSYKISREHVNKVYTQIECYVNNELIKTFDSQEEAAMFFDTSEQNINQAVIRGMRGKLFRGYTLIRGKRVKITQQRGY